MKVSARILLAGLAAVLFVAACSNGPKVIPRSKMEKICSDMLLADQWEVLNGIPRFKIDTTLFYEPIFRKYGYTTDDFRASLEYYMRDPIKMSRMMKKIAIQMEDQAAALRNIQLGPDGEAVLEEDEMDTEQ